MLMNCCCYLGRFSGTSE